MAASGNDGRQGRPGFWRHHTIAVTCVALAVGTLGLTFAAVPLYRVYCQSTGYWGTTQRAENAPDKVLDRTITVRFDSNVSPELPWTFEPEQRTLKVKIGENTLAFYKATNNSDHAIIGTAVFNVTPDAVGAYFDKIQCFCSTEQRLEAGQSADMAVSFYIDPEYVKDDDTKDFSEITVSYTFYPAPASKQTLGEAAASEKSGG
jgi:cytochrome c oxidase assembly protein subunit 11